MKVREIHSLLSSWAPKEIAWEKDNVGLQVGDNADTVSGVLVCLDCTPAVVAEARRKKANLIVSHHPLLFRAPKRITPHDEIGVTIRQLIANRMNLYSAHTNLDFTRGGTSHAIAAALGLKEVEFLHRGYRTQKKIVTFVPEQHVARVREAMARAGAGVIGNYSECSFETRGLGSFKGNVKSSPRFGKRNQLEKVPEIRLEMIAHQHQVDEILRAMREAHPYEEVAFDVYPLENVSDGFGMGIIGTLPKPMIAEMFVRHVKKSLHATAVRHTRATTRSIRRVAACGGSGSELTDTAIAREADAFVTADVKYHDFHHADGKILLMDAGHYETEHLVVQAVVSYLRNELKALGVTIPVSATRISTNPILYS